MASRGLVIGKFWPPHRGHKYLIDTAAAQVDELTVLVCDGAGQIPEAPLRAKWLQEIHPTVRVELAEDNLPPDDSLAWAKYTLERLGYRPDVVFTSEAYGELYTHYLGCRHVLVDRERNTVPISGTMIRSDPLAYWDYLEPPVRAYYAKRVCVLGAESTGTTTMAQALAEHYQTQWVPEYGREYSAWKQERGEFGEWTTEEFVHIAQEQANREDKMARAANRILICDTDAFATHIWHWRYVGFFSPEVERVGRDRQYDLYLLTDVDIPFVQDGLRDGEHIRHEMHTVFEQELQRRGHRYAVLSGTHAERLRQATALIDALMKSKFAQPE